MVAKAADKIGTNTTSKSVLERLHKYKKQPLLQSTDKARLDAQDSSTTIYKELHC